MQKYLEKRGRIPNRGRPPVIPDGFILSMLPATCQAIAETYGMDRTSIYARLRWLENEGTVSRDRARRPHIWEET